MVFRIGDDLFKSDQDSVLSCTIVCDQCVVGDLWVSALSSQPCSHTLLDRTVPRAACTAYDSIRVPNAFVCTALLFVVAAK